MVCAGGRTARPRTLRLEGRSQAKLDQAWKIVLASYLTKVGTGTTASIRRSELRVIESIEELPPELEPISVVRTKLSVLEDGEVKVPRSVISDVWLGPRIVAVVVHPGRPVGEYGSIKPMGQPRLQRTGSQRRGPCFRRAGTAHTGDVGVAQWAWAATDDDRKALLEGDDGIDSPSADYLIANSVHVAGKLLTPAKGQIQNGTEDQTLWNVESIQAPEAAAVIDIEVVPARGGGLEPIDFRVGVIDEFGDGVAGQHLRASREALLHLQLHRVVDGIAVIRLGHREVIKLRVRPEQLAFLYHRLCARVTRYHWAVADRRRSAIPGERVRNQRSQRRYLLRGVR